MSAENGAGKVGQSGEGKVKKPRKKDRINEIRAVLGPLFDKAPIKGRTWGIILDGDNDFFGSHITIGRRVEPGKAELLMIAEHRRTKRLMAIPFISSREYTSFIEEIMGKLEESGFEVDFFRNQEE